MDTLLALKPILTTLVLPATSGLLAILALLVWAWRRNARAHGRLPVALAGVVTLVLWLLSCQAVALWLSLHLLPQVKPITGEDLKRNQVQAIVVLGGGVNSQAQEYGQPTLAPEAMARLLYGDYLSRSGHLPIAYSGGKGWAAPQSWPAVSAPTGDVDAALERSDPAEAANPHLSSCTTQTLPTPID